MSSHIATVEEDWDRNKIHILRMISDYPNVTAKINSVESNIKIVSAKMDEAQIVCNKSMLQNENNTKDIEYLKGVLKTNVRIHIFSNYLFLTIYHFLYIKQKLAENSLEFLDVTENANKNESTAAANSTTSTNDTLVANATSIPTSSTPLQSTISSTTPGLASE